MRIFSRYIIREHIGPFFFAFAIITAMLVLNFVLQAMRYIIGKGIPIEVILEFIIYNMAWMVVLIAPMSVLVSTIMAFGRFASDNEITAIKAGGISFFRLLIPVLVTAIILMAGVFYFNDQLLPVANHKARILKRSIQNKRPTLSIQPGVFLDGIDNFSLLIENKDELGNAIYGVTLFDRTSADVIRTITAKQGTIDLDESTESMIVTLQEGELHELSYSRHNQYQRMVFQQYRLVIPVENMALKKSDEEYRNDREKTIRQLMEDIEYRLQERQRRVNTVVNILNQDPALAGALEPRYRQILLDQVFRVSWLDRISDAFLELNRRLTIPVSARDTNIVTLDAEKKSAITKQIRNIQNIQNIQNSSTQKADPAMVVLPGADLFSTGLSKSTAFGDTMTPLRSASLQQMTASLSVIGNYQRMIDQIMIEVNKKYSIPAACIVFVLLGAPIGVKARRGNLGIAGGISLFFFIAYYFCLVLGEDYGDRQLLNPFFAMWFPNIILGFTGLLLTYQTTSERTFGFHHFIPETRRLWQKLFHHKQKTKHEKSSKTP